MQYLFCLHHAGGNSYAFQELQRHLDKNIQLVTLDLPGHGRRIKEPLLSDIHDMSSDLFSQIKSKLSNPYGIYGHSMGGLLGFMLIHQIRHHSLLMPRHLWISSTKAPEFKYEDGAHLLFGNEFYHKIIHTYGGLPEELMKEKELLDFFEPIIRADFQAVETFQYHKYPKLNIPFTVILGSNEKSVTTEQARAWQNETSIPITFKQFSGNHFFIFQHLADIGKLISIGMQSHSSAKKTDFPPE